MQTLSVKLLSCKILKTKNSVSFEVQYYSRLLHSINSLLKILTLYQVPWMTKTGRTSRVFRRPTRKNARRHTTTTSTPWSGDGDNKKKLYSFVKKNKYDSSSVASLKKDGNTVGEARGKAEVLNSQFSSVFTEEGDSPIPNLGTRSTPDAPNIQVGRNCVMKLLRGLKPHKAKGPDEISSRFLKEMASPITPALTLIYQASLEQGQISDEWKTANVAPIFKKGDKSKPSNYRPVSLTSIFCKIVKHILHSHIFEGHHILSDFQHGFRKHRSCKSQLILTINDLARGLDNPQQITIR